MKRYILTRRLKSDLHPPGCIVSSKIFEIWHDTGGTYLPRRYPFGPKIDQTFSSYNWIKDHKVAESFNLDYLIDLTVIESL